MDLSEQSERMQSFYDLAHDPFGAIVDSMVFSGTGGRYEIAETLRHLLAYSQQDSQLEGPVGSGKRMLAQQVIKMLDESWRVAWVDAADLDSPKALEKELIGQFGLGLKAEHDPATLLKQINEVVSQRYAEEESFLLVVQRADQATAEVFQMLSALRQQIDDTDHRIRQLWLVEDAEALPDEDDTAWYRHELGPLTDDDAGQYIRDRMIAAGYVEELPIPDSDIARLNQLSSGIPFQLNELARDYLISSTFKTTERKQSFPLTHVIAGVAALSLVTVAFLYQSSESPEIDSPLPSQSEPSDRPLSSVEQRLADAVAQVEARQQSTQDSTEQSSPTETSESANTALINAEEVSDGAEPEPELETESAAVVEVQSPEDNRANQPSLLERGADSQFTVQLIGVRDRTQLVELIATFSDPQNVGIIETSYQDAPWFVLIYGQFDSRIQAQAAFEQLPDGLFTSEPWIRTFQSLRSSL